MKMKKFFDYLMLTIGSIIVAAGLELILGPNGLVDGGVTALSIMARALWDVPIWIPFLMMNIPIIALSARHLGKRFVIRTVYANIVTSLAIIWMTPMPAITSSEVLIVLYGGLLLGLGIGLVVKVGGAIDGTEILAIWFSKHFHISISTFLLAINAIILTGAAFVFTLEKAMFSIAVFYIVTKVIDFVLDGLNQGKSLLIISEKPEEIGQQLMEQLDARITYLHGEGGYTGDKKKIIYCITNRIVYPKIKDLILSIDPEAVIEASYVTETTGVRQKSMLSK